MEESTIISSTTLVNSENGFNDTPVLTIQDLPDDTLRTVCQYLDLWNIEKLGTVSKSFNVFLGPIHKDIRASVQGFRSSPDIVIAQWIKKGYTNSSSNQITKCLYEGYTFGLSPSAVGRYITSPGDKDWESRQARAIILVSRYLNNFYFIPSTTPVQALRQVLQRTRLPPSHGRVSLLLRRIAMRYLDCIQGRGGSLVNRENSNGTRSLLVPPTYTTTWTDHGLATFEMSYSESMVQEFNNQYQQNRYGDSNSNTLRHGLSSSSSSSSNTTSSSNVSLSPPRSPYGTELLLPSIPLRTTSNSSSSSFVPDALSFLPIIHGYDVSNLDVETVYVMLYAFLILNQDLHCDAVKKKMTMEDFSSRNSTIASLAMIPSQFWDNCYAEILHEPLPIIGNDDDNTNEYDERNRNSRSSTLFTTISNFIAHNNPLQHILSNNSNGSSTTTTTTTTNNNSSTAATSSSQGLTYTVSSLVTSTVTVATNVVSNVYQYIHPSTRTTANTTQVSSGSTEDSDRSETYGSRDSMNADEQQ